MKPTIFLFLQIFFQFQTIFIITYASKNSRSTLDLSLQQFSEDGAVQQVLYASKCVANSLPVFGFVDEDDNCAVIIAPFRRQNPLEIGKKRQRVEIFESAVGITTIGYPQDCSHIKNYANKIIQLHKFKYGEIMPLHGLANQLSSWLTRCMYPNPNNRKDNIARPIAVSTFICKYESNQLQSKLYLIENTGIIKETKFSMIGSKFISIPNIDNISNICHHNEKNHIRKINEITDIILQELEETLYDIEYLILNKNQITYFESIAEARKYFESSNVNIAQSNI